jgi:hypothetical protein
LGCRRERELEAERSVGEGEGVGEETESEGKSGKGKRGRKKKKTGRSRAFKPSWGRLSQVEMAQGEEVEVVPLASATRQSAGPSSSSHSNGA